MEITVNVNCPDLALAASTLALALTHATPTAAPATPVTPPAVAVSAPSPAPVAPPVPSVAAPDPATASPSNLAPAPAAPVAPAPQITLAQIGKAGADLVAKNPAVIPQLAALLQKYGVQAVQQIKPEQIGAFATDLRGLGAAI